MAKLDDVVDELVGEALLESCEVLHCRQAADLDVMGRIGALLRY